MTWEQARKKVETLFEPPTLKGLSSLVQDGAPAGAIALQAVLVEELSVLQLKLKAGGDATEPHRGFYSGDKPLNEEMCRDHLLLLLQHMPFDINLRPEGHVADDKEIDIECSLGRELMVPIEVKGQWHKDLWHAADTQLARLYTTDWRADRRGIYLVLWFGDKGKRLTAPPKGITTPKTPEALREMLVERSQAARENLVEVVVLDLTRL